MLSILQVSIFFSRDLDSTIGAREAAAAKEFLSSNTDFFHVMRDHPAHTAEILGGMWGAKSSALRPNFVEAFREMHKVCHRMLPL